MSMVAFPNIKSRWLALALILVLALLFRWGYYQFYHHGTFSGDEETYHQLAVSLMQSGAYNLDGRPTAYRAPLLPILLSLIYRFSGPSLSYASGFIILVGVATCGLIWSMGTRVFGTGVGTTAGFIAAIYPGFIRWSDYILTEPLFLCCVCLAGWFFMNEARQPDRKKLVAAGLLLGLAFLARAVLVAFPLFLLLWAYLRWPRRGQWGQRFQGAALVIVSMGLVMSVWIGRNYLTLGEFIPGTTSSGNNLVGTNNLTMYANLRTRGTWSNAWPPEMFRPADGFIDSQGQLTSQWFALSEAQQQNYFQRRGLEWIVAHPGHMVAMLPFKWGRVWLQAFSRGWPLWFNALYSVLYYLVLLPFGFVGLVRLWQQNNLQTVALWLTLALYITALHAIFDGDMRYRIAVEPGIILTAAYGLHASWQHLQNRPTRLPAQL